MGTGDAIGILRSLGERSLQHNKICTSVSWTTKRRLIESIGIS